MEQKNKKIISILVEDEFGALSRIIELFGSRGLIYTPFAAEKQEKKDLTALTIPRLLLLKIIILTGML